MEKEIFNEVLVSADGQFRCISEHAVEVAYMLSDIESYVDRHSDIDSEWDIGVLIMDYLKGGKTPQEVQEVIREWRKEDSE